MSVPTIPPATTQSARPAGAGSGSMFPATNLVAFLLTVSIFFVWGMSNNLTDILVQQFRKSFELNLIEAQLVQTAVFLAYFLMATPAALLMRRFGYKVGLITGLCVFATGTLLFWPAAVIGQYTPFLIALFVVGSGSSILETAANPLIAEFGDPATSERRLNFAAAFNPPGSITGLVVGTFFIFSGVEKSTAEVSAMKAAGTYASYLHTEILRVVPTYVGLGCAVLLLAFALSRAQFPAALGGSSQQASRPGAYGRLFRSRGLMLAVLAQLSYVGAQVSTWSSLIPYMRQYTTHSEREAGFFLAGNLVALTVGRVLSTWLMRWIRPVPMMIAYALINCSLLGLAILHPGMAGAVAILITSFFMSMMFPTIFALGVEGLGEDTKPAGGFLVMATGLGGATFPPLMGWIARATGSIATSYALPAMAYVIVLLYALTARKLSPGMREVESVPQNV